MCNSRETHGRTAAPSRRDVLRGALAGAGILALGPVARAITPAAGAGPLTNHKRCVVIYCYGGFDGLNMLVPVTNSAYYSRRPSLAIPAGSTIALSGNAEHALHPALVSMADLHNTDGRLAFIRKVGYPEANLSHFTSRDVFSHGVRGSFLPLGIPESGWVARYASTHAPTPMGAVSVGVGRPLDLVGGTSNPLLVKKLADFEFQPDSRYRNNHELRRDTIRRLLRGFSGSPLASEVAGALDQGDSFAAQIQNAVEAYQPSPGVTYPTDSPGRYLRDVATLIQAGFETRVFFTGFGGWDTHGNQGALTGRQADLMTRLDQGLGAFVSDLKGMGVWNDTLILLVSEFGRRNFENSSGGTDHGHGNIFFAMGGTVVGGFHGPSITETDVADQGFLDYAIDFRDVYREAIQNHLGHDATPVFPEAQDINTTIGYVV